MTDTLFNIPTETTTPPDKTCTAFPDGSGYPLCLRPIRSNGLCDAHNQQRAAGKALGPIRRRRRNMPEFCTFTPGRDDSADPCGLPAIGDGLCNGHYQQKQRGKPLVPLHTLRISQEGAEELRSQGMKWCPLCSVAKPFEAFPRNASTIDNCSPYCSPCSADYQIANRFGFPSVGALREFRESRDHRCDICKRQRQEDGPAFHIDHDGSCCGRNKSCGKCVRGYLCQMCNTCGVAWYEMVGRCIATIPVFEDYLSQYETRRAGSNTYRPATTGRLATAISGQPELPTTEARTLVETALVSGPPACEGEQVEDVWSRTTFTSSGVSGDPTPLAASREERGADLLGAGRGLELAASR